MNQTNGSFGGKLIGLGCLAAGLYSGLGLLGLVLTLTVAAPVFSNLTPYNLTYGQVVVAATMSLTSKGVLLAEAGVLVLLAAFLEERTTLRWALSGLIVVIGLGGIVRLTWHSGSGITSAMLVPGVAALVLYGVHRYEKVKLGLVEPNP